MRYQSDLNKKRWLAYFDLLGIRRLLADGKELDVFVAYDKAIRECGNIERWTGRLQHAWFSDTFLIMAPDDSSTSFRDVDHMARVFTDSLLHVSIPLRGAVSYGCLYADFENKVFFGNGLVEAYEYGEGQDWMRLLTLPPVARPSFQVSNRDDNNLIGRKTVYDLLWKSLDQHAARSVIGRQRTYFRLRLN